MVHIGTCSWKFDSWKGILYDHRSNSNYLTQYSRRFNTVEIDRWFWSLFSPSTAVKLPQKNEVQDLKRSTGSEFRFTAKVPNSISLTHYYRKKKNLPLQINPHFLSVDLYHEFLNRVQPIAEKISVLMLQFEYLNRRKMSSLDAFHRQVDRFLNTVSRDIPLALEVRNPHYLTPGHFEFLAARDVTHVFSHGYYMPSVFDLYDRFSDSIQNLSVIRLLGRDRKGIEQRTRASWDRIVHPQDRELDLLADMIKRQLDRGIDVYVNVNNHYEGSAPLTIARLEQRLRKAGYLSRAEG